MNDIKYIETDPKVILQNLIKNYEELTGEVLYPGDERRLFLYNQAQIIVALANSQNEALKSNLLRYAEDEKLNALGEFTDTLRLEANYAKCKCKITLKAVQNFDVVIPNGTRLTPDGKLFFKTSEDLVIKTGETAGIVNLTATQTGKDYNGFLPGQIKNIVDPIGDYILEVANIETSLGGSDLENNERYRERIRLAPRGFSTAGPIGAYEYHAKSTHNSIGDVQIFSPSPGVVKVVILLKNGEIPSQSILDDVYNNLSAKNKRPLTDKVEVGPPSLFNYDINFTYYILKENLLDEAKIKQNINAAVEEYKLWQKSALGKSINPDYLRKLVLNAGANRIVVTAPTFTLLDVDRVAVPNNINVNYGGLD